MKKSFIILAFALLALLTPLGAKGHENQEPDRALSVHGARLRAGLNTSVTFGGYVNFKGLNQFFVQDNYTYPDGAGILVYCDNVSHANINQVRVGTYVRITATKVSYSTLDGGSVYIDTHDYGAIEIVSQDNELAVQNVTLQQLKDAHYPLSNKLISDHYQYRLVRLTNLQVVGYQQGYGYFVEDLNHVRDTIRCNESLNLNDWQGISELVAIDNRDNHIYTYGSLLVRFSDDVTTYFSLYQARHLAGTNMPVSTSGVVIGKRYNGGIYYVQSEDASGLISGIELNYVDNLNLSVGDFVAFDANSVKFNNGYERIFVNEMSNHHVYHLGITPTARNVTLETLKNSHYPITPSRTMNDSWQDTRVKLTNLTVIEHLGANRYYIVENANGTRDTLYLENPMDLSAGLQLASVTAVNCRESGNGIKLYVVNADDIQFPATRTIHYARTHLNQTHQVEGVINYVGPINNYGWAYASIQDNTGGLEIRLYPPFPTVGDRVIMQVRPINQTGDLIESSDNAIISTLGHDEAISPASTDIGTLYQQNQSNPGNGRYEGCLIQLQNVVVLSAGVYTFSIYQNGNEDQFVFVDYDVLPTEDREYLSSQLQNGTIISNIIGAKSYPAMGSGHTINLRSLDDIEIATPHDINLSVYPSELNGSIFTATLSQSGGTTITQAVAGQRVYLHLSTTTPDNPSTITYLKASNANYSKLMHHSTRCTSGSELQLTRVNSTTWSFTMPNYEVDFEALFTPTPNYDAICSDVWEAREGALNFHNAPMAYLKGVVTSIDVTTEDAFVLIGDIRNANTGDDPLKAYCGIWFSLDINSIVPEVGDNVVVCGYPVNNMGRINLAYARFLSTLSSNQIVSPYATNFNDIWDDMNNNQGITHSRLQDRTVQLSGITIEESASSSTYNVSQGATTATLETTAELNVGSTYDMVVINMTDTSDEQLWLRLCSEDDLIGANEITFGTNRVEFDEFGGTVSVPLSIGANLVGTPVLTTDSYNMSFTATMNSDHTAINITVPAKTDTENGIGTITVTVDGDEATMSVVQTGCTAAEFTLNPSYAVYDAEDTDTHTLQVSHIQHVDTSSGSSYIWANVLEMDMMGTDWINFDQSTWNATTQSFSFSLEANTGTEPRGVMISVHLHGTDGNWTSHDATIWQNPQAAAMTLEPNVVEWGATSLCVPVTKTVTVAYENAFDQQGYNGYNADYVWLDLWNLGSDFYTDIVVEPEVVPVDESGSGSAIFTLTYTPSVEGYHDGTLWARIGEYDLVNHEGIPGGAASPQIWASASSSNPFYGWTKLTSMDGVESMGMTTYSLVPMDNTEQGEYINFYIPEPGLYCIQMMTDFLTWDGSSLSQEYFDPWMDYPENRFLWTISFDADGNALISPYSDDSYHISWNNDDEYYQYFECVTSGGNPVQIYRLMDGSIPAPTISAPAEWFMDGETLDITITPAEGTNANYAYYTQDGEYVYGETAEPFTFTTYETTVVTANSSTCDNSSEYTDHTYYKVNDIYDVRVDADGEDGYSIKGIVTYSDNDMLFIQDQSGAIHATKDDIDEWIYTGDEVILNGFPQTENYSWKTLVEAQYGLKLSENNTVLPIVTTFADLLSNPMDYQAQLVKVEGVTVGYHDEEGGYYYLYNSNQMMGLRDTYEGGYPFFLEQGAFIDLTAVFVKYMANDNIDFLIRDDDEDIVIRETHAADLLVYSDENLSTPNAAWNGHVYLCDESGNPMNNSSFTTNSPVYFAIEEGYSVGLNANNLPVISVCDATTGEMIYDSYTNFMVCSNSSNNHMFAFSMPDADVTVKVWLVEGSVGESCNIVFDLVDSWGDGWNGNYLVVTDSYGTSQELTIESGNSATYTLSFPTGTHIVLGWTYGSYSNECSFTVSYDNGIPIYSASAPEGTTLYDFDVDCNVAPPTYTITATASPTAAGSISGTGTYDFGTTCTLEATPAAGYVFLYWEVDGVTVSTNATYIFTVTEDVNLVAHFADESDGCIVVFDLADSYGDGWNGNALVVTDSYGISQQLTIESGNSAVHFLQYPSGTHIMLSWIMGSFTSECSFMVSYAGGAQIYEATEIQEGFSYEFDVNCGEPTPTYYTISATASPSNGGTVSGDGTFEAGTTCTLTATANAGYHFVNWMSVTGAVVSTNAIYTFTVIEDADLVANFEMNFYTIVVTIDHPANGTISGGGIYNYGETATLVATPNEGYTYFVNWTKDGEVVSTNATYSFIVTEDAEFMAHFALNQYEITVAANPAAGGTVSGGGIYTRYETATLVATPNSGYTFTNWTKDGSVVSTNATYSFMVFEPGSYVANFEENQVTTYTITATANPANGGTVSGAGTFAEGETCTLIATANAGYSFVNWMSVTGAVVSTNAIYTFTVTQDADFVAVFEENEPGGEITQTTNFANGWNWWSGYIELGSNGLGELQNSLGTHGMMIKSQNDGYASFLEGYGWYGSLSSINNESTYQVRTNEACTVEMTGSAANPADHPITLNSGWTWVGYPVNASMSVAEALAGITPQNGDMLKSQNNGYASYLAGFGWYGSLNTLQPGMGLMFKSNNSSAITLTYPNGGPRTDLKANQTTESNYWQPNLNAYPDNMSVMAVVELDGNELQSENYELAAFANGEVRGSARLLYVEPLNRYMAFLTVAGDEAAELHFGLYDTETGMVETQNVASLQYETNAVVGSFAEPYVVSFRGTTGVDEWARSLQVYPNPVEHGQVVSLGFDGAETGKVRVEIINALGTIVETQSLVSPQVTSAIKTPNTPGVYTLRITVEGKGTCYRKLVVR